MFTTKCRKTIMSEKLIYALSSSVKFQMVENTVTCIPYTINDNSYFYAPLEKGGILFCNCLSVGRSVCRSVDQVLSGQYLLTPSLDQYQTWYRGCPQWVDDPYWFSGHMIKGQGQTTLLSPLCCPVNIFWPLHLINTILGTGVALNE